MNVDKETPLFSPDAIAIPRSLEEACKLFATDITQGAQAIAKLEAAGHHDAAGAYQKRLTDQLTEDLFGLLDKAGLVE